MGRLAFNWEKVIQEEFQITEKEFWAEYHKKLKLGTRSLGRMLGCSSTVVGKRLDVLKLKRHSPGKDQRSKKRQKSFKDVPEKIEEDDAWEGDL